MAFQNVDGVQNAYPPPGQTLSEFDLALDVLAQTFKNQIAATNHAAQTYLDAVRDEAYKQLET